VTRAIRTLRSPCGVTAVLAAAVVLAGTGGCAAATAAPPPVSAPALVSNVSFSGTAADDASTSARRVVPSDVLLPDEGEPSTSPVFSDWTTDYADEPTWLLDPCRPTAHPTDARRASFRTVSRTGPESTEARQLAVYATPEIAAEVVAGFRRVLDACRTGGQRAPGTGWWVSGELPGLGDEGLVAASTTGGADSSPTGERIAVTRVGSAVFLAYLSGEFATAELDDGTRRAQHVAKAFLDSL
jgi:hypothetical protein